ncbi:MAG: virulence RhuM family protein [Paludibacteraceae bacterium]|nr:virulence RhuM family protein [Paludibacteraceae bacterium]
MFENQNPQKGEVVLYQPNETIRIEVRMENETVWLTQAQMAELFDKSVSVISRHISNVFEEGELEEESNLHFLQIANSDKPVKYFSLDVIISVGYRVKSLKGTMFRKWANKVLKEHILHTNTIVKRFEQLESRVNATESKIDFFVRTSLPPVEGVFSDGQIFDAYTFACDLIRSLTLQTCRNFHDRFLLVDDKVYHIGASLKDLGKKLFAFSLLEDFRVEEILAKVVI